MHGFFQRLPTLQNMWQPGTVVSLSHNLWTPPLVSFLSLLSKLSEVGLQSTQRGFYVFRVATATDKFYLAQTVAAIVH